MNQERTSQGELGKKEVTIAGLFRSFFRQERASLFNLAIGILIRTDKLGVTSVVRDLALRPESYESIIRFFRACSWHLPSLQSAWVGIVARHAPPWRFRGRVVLIGDGVKKSKEGLKMPGVKRLKQESETQSKAACFYGYFGGCVGIFTHTSALRIQENS